MNINITNRKGLKLQLTGDMLTGETFAMKDYIKSYMDGKWVADKKAWQVNIEKVNKLIASYALTIDTEAVAPVAQPSGMTYAQFVRSADAANSDF